MEVTALTVPRAADGIRLDLFLIRYGSQGLTRGTLQRAIRDGYVRITGKRVVKPSTTVHAGQEIVLHEAVGKRQSAALERGSLPTAHSLLPELVILHEDQYLIVLDKPAGVPVQRGVKTEPSLVDALIARYPTLTEVGESLEQADPPTSLGEALRAGPPASPDAKHLRAGIVHRLDKDTSGVLLVARTQEMYEHLKRQFQRRQVRKEYVALVHGSVPENAGTVKLPITRSKRNPLRRTIAQGGEGKDAETSFQVLERFREHTLLAVFPRTGRMHQIRVHLAHLGFPVAGDALYGRKSHYRTPPGLQRQFLHAHALTVTLPSRKQQTFESPLPADLTTALTALRHDGADQYYRPVTYRWRSPRPVSDRGA